MSAVTMPPPVPVGEIKRFGPFGPKYMVEITLVESGEKAEYRLTHLSDDPEAY